MGNSLEETGNTYIEGECTKPGVWLWKITWPTMTRRQVCKLIKLLKSCVGCDKECPSNMLSPTSLLPGNCRHRIKTFLELLFPIIFFQKFWEQESFMHKGLLHKITTLVSWISQRNLVYWMEMEPVSKVVLVVCLWYLASLPTWIGSKDISPRNPNVLRYRPKNGAREGGIIRG